MKIKKISQQVQQVQEELEMPFPTWLHQQTMEYTKGWTKRLPITQDDLNTIAEWVYATKPNLMGLNLEQASEEAWDWKIEKNRKKHVKNYKTHDVVYKFKDGWEIVKLSHEMDIVSENVLMRIPESKGGQEESPIGTLEESEYGRDQFIGEVYIDSETNQTKMKEGEYVIYSLRDPNNYPHATIEIETDNSDLQVLQIFSGEELTETKEAYGFTKYSHPQETKVKEFLAWLKTQGYNLTPLGLNEEVKVKDLADTPLENEYGIPLTLWGIGGNEDAYYENLMEAFQEGYNGGSQWHERGPKKAVDAIVVYAINNNELNELQQAIEGYSIQAKNKEGKEYTQFKGLEEWASNTWLEAEEQIQFDNPRPDDEDYPVKEDFITPPAIPEGQEEFKEMPEAQPVFNEEAYNQAVKEYQEAETAYEEELTQHQEYFEPYEFSNYVYKEVHKALEAHKGKEEQNKEVSKKTANMNTRIYKIAKEEVPDAINLALYAESLKSYIKDIPNLDEQIVELIEALPAPRKIRQDFSLKECEVLFETIGYVWKKLTGQKLIQEKEMTDPPETLMGNYLLVKPGILLHGINIYGIVKQNASLISTLLNINGFALQEYLCNKPNNLIKFLLENGAIRLFINKQKNLYAQMSSETYGKFGKQKIKKYDFKNKIVKIIDFEAPYNGWKSGIAIKL